MTEIEKLDETFMKYVDTPNTDYAILLDGDWGSGKTYYLKNHLVERLKNERNEIKVHYVSLFGIKNIGDFSSKILLEVLHVKNNNIKVIGKSLLTFFGKQDIAKESSIEILDAIDKIDSKTLFLFDDFERVNPKELIEIIGYINQFVEHAGAKVIIAANKNEIDELKKSETKLGTFLEKLVRYSIHFIVPFKNIANGIFEKHCIKPEIQIYIINAFKSGRCNNLRTLQFVSSVCSDILRSIPENGLPKKYKEKLEELTIYFASLIGIEIKNGSLKIEEARKLSGFSLSITLNSLFDDLTNIEIKDEGKKKKRIIRKISERIDPIREKYFDSRRVMYFDSIVDFLYTGFLDKERFQTEVEECINHLEKQLGSEEGKAWSTLCNFTLLEDNELSKYIDLVLNFAFEGKYPLDNYYPIFILIRSISKLKLHIVDEKLLLEKVTHGLKRSTTIGFNVELFDKPEESDEYLSKLYCDLMSHYAQSLNLSLKQAGDEHLKRIFYDPYNYLEREANNGEVKAHTFNQSISPTDFLSQFDISLNVNKDNISKIFYLRTRDNVAFTKAELSWTKELKVEIEKSMEGAVPSIANLNKESLLHAVKKILEHWSASEPHLK